MLMNGVFFIVLFLSFNFFYLRSTRMFDAFSISCSVKKNRKKKENPTLYCLSPAAIKTPLQFPTSSFLGDFPFLSHPFTPFRHLLASLPPSSIFLVILHPFKHIHLPTTSSVFCITNSSVFISSIFHFWHRNYSS